MATMMRINPEMMRINPDDDAHQPDDDGRRPNGVAPPQQSPKLIASRF